MPATVTALVGHFETIYQRHMQSLPIVNRSLHVEAIGFQEFDGDQLGVLITPWFMNLVLLPQAVQTANCVPGDKSSVEFPSGSIEFTGCKDDTLGFFRTAVLFRTVADLPDQEMARSVAQQVMRDLFVRPGSARAVSRRALLTGRGVA
jgi:[NiFe] hydrogenase assembly HybE family chaperone